MSEAGVLRFARDIESAKCVRRHAFRAVSGVRLTRSGHFKATYKLDAPRANRIRYLHRTKGSPLSLRSVLMIASCSHATAHAPQAAAGVARQPSASRRSMSSSEPIASCRARCSSTPAACSSAAFFHSVVTCTRAQSRRQASHMGSSLQSACNHQCSREGKSSAVEGAAAIVN